MKSHVHKGLTLVELLLALALSAIVVAASTSWIQLSAHMVVARVDEMGEEANAIFRLIHDDLRSFDRPSERNRSSGVPLWRDRIKCEENSLVIQTRESGFGQVVHRYVLVDGILTRATKSDAGEPSNSRVLIADVESFECEINVETEVLSVRIVLQSPISDDYGTRDVNAGKNSFSRSFDLR
jgi:prepilin-type N-terminal cleavage/methylation domain-containing protein